MRKVTLFFVVILSSCCAQSPDPVMWLEWHGYSGISLREEIESTIGPHSCLSGPCLHVTCFSGQRSWAVEAYRKPVPEENPCILVRVHLRLCCSAGRRGACEVREILSECGDFRER